MQVAPRSGPPETDPWQACLQPNYGVRVREYDTNSEYLEQLIHLARAWVGAAWRAEIAMDLQVAPSCWAAGWPDDAG